MSNRSPVRFISFGGGVNSVALLLRLVREGNAPERVIFADTGEERAATYRYLKGYIEPFCEAHGIPLDVVQSKRGPMVAWMTENRLFPSREKRDCTFHWKVYPIRRHLRSLGVKKAVALLGIAWDESQRERPSDVQWVTNEFPLIERRMTRADCEAEIKAHGWPSPGKSACVGCFNGGERELASLARTDPTAFSRWREMEEKSRRYPKLTFLEGTRLAWIEKAARDQRTLDSFPAGDGGECLGGACPV